VKATRVLKTSGRILAAAFQDSQIRFLVYEAGAYRREDGTVLERGPLKPNQRIRLQGSQTLIGQGGSLSVYKPGTPPTTVLVDQYRNLPVFDANAERKVWIANGRLLRDGKLGDGFTETLGQVLPHQTLVWLGPKFGFGFYRASDLSVFFTFDPNHLGVNDSITVPNIRGQLIDATCVFSSDYCWFLTVTQEATQLVHRCTLIRSDGRVEATFEAGPGQVPWLTSIRGKTASKNQLFAPTDSGIVRLEAQQGTIVQTHDYPDTEPFVDAGSRLIVSSKGIFVIEKQEITRLEISTTP
jgi:hypothetical protein